MTRSGDRGGSVVRAAVICALKQVMVAPAWVAMTVVTVPKGGSRECGYDCNDSGESGDSRD